MTVPHTQIRDIKNNRPVQHKVAVEFGIAALHLNFPPKKSDKTERIQQDRFATEQFIEIIRRSHFKNKDEGNFFAANLFKSEWKIGAFRENLKSIRLSDSNNIRIIPKSNKRLFNKNFYSFYIAPTQIDNEASNKLFDIWLEKISKPQEKYKSFAQAILSARAVLESTPPPRPLPPRLAARFDEIYELRALLSKKPDTPADAESIFAEEPPTEKAIENAKKIIGKLSPDRVKLIEPENIRPSGMGGMTISIYQLPVRNATFLIGDEVASLVVVSRKEKNVKKRKLNLADERTYEAFNQELRYFVQD